MELTQIQITKQTRKELQTLKLTKRESYEEIIERLILNEKNKCNSTKTK